jgi:hypothetical protein
MVEYEDGMKGAGYSICSRRHWKEKTTWKAQAWMLGQ